MAPTRWGIAGCGLISSDFVNAVQHLGSDKHVVVAVAARSRDSAQKFAQKFGVETFYGSYDELAKQADIDVIYIGNVNSGHIAAGQTMLTAGKPVLCEKPLCISLAETRQLVDLAKKQKLFLMEAMWARYFPCYREMQARLDKAVIGPVMQAFVSFGVPVAAVPRVSQRALGGGSILDIGIYAIQFLLFVMGHEKPLEIKAMSLVKDGLEHDVTCSMRFSNDRFGTFILSTRCLMPNKAFVTGTKGTLELGSPFWCPLTMTGPPEDFNAPLDPSERVYNYDNSQGLGYQAEEVARCLRQGELESPIMPHSTTLLLADIIQTVREQLGIKI